MKYCCQDLDEYLEEKKVTINYDHIFRSYSIDYLTSNLSHEINYCPWCGTKFLKSLRDEFWDIIFGELKIDTDAFRFVEDPLVPEEFKSEEWWRKRGL